MKIRKLPEFTDESVLVLWEALDGFYDYFRIQIETGISELWQVNEKSYAITRLEMDRSVNQVYLVVCCYAGENIRAFARHIIEVCEANNWFIRMHTRNKTIATLMQRNYHFNKPEFILIRNI